MWCTIVAVFFPTITIGLLIAIILIVRKFKAERQDLEQEIRKYKKEK